ncbi:N-6 DNA methylase, partial [Streptomyces sp. NA02950]|uniref:N-6 DNA methylase n=1 Tax=Streptomyces sp. NA02950 TaxID=2742137 RepID=UPI001C375A83
GTVTVNKKGLGVRATLGSWYTPPEVAEAMCRLSIGPQLDRLAQHPDPGNLLQVLSIDPACGAGVFLIEAARLIAGRLAERVSGISPAPAVHMKYALPVVMRECIFGVDIDPVAVDLARTALWLEIDGREPFDFMDRNVIVGNALDDEMPPAFTERRGDLPTAAERRGAWDEAHH